MKLTEKERISLYNQYKILAALYPKEAEIYNQYCEVLHDGYELEYEEFTNFLHSGLTREECVEVIDIMDMFAHVQRCYEKLPDKCGIDKYKISFQGFSGNEETLQMSYARFLQKDGRFTELKTKDCNSHYPALRGHRNMLAEWSASEDKYNLTKEDILRIQSMFAMH